MSWFGGDKKQSTSDAARKQAREITRAQRTVQRNTADLEREEKKLEMQIKQLAKQGQNAACIKLAQQLVAIRKQKTRSIAANSKIGAVGSQVKTMGANSVVANAIASTSSAMKVANDQMDPAKLAAIMNQFQKEDMNMKMKDEMIEETLDEMFDNSEDEQEQDMVVNKILDEIGIEVSEKLSKVRTPSSNLDISSSTSKITDADIEALLSGKTALKH